MQKDCGFVSKVGYLIKPINSRHSPHEHHHLKVLNHFSDNPYEFIGYICYMSPMKIDNTSLKSSKIIQNHPKSSKII